MSEAELREARERLVELHRSLVDYGLVAWTQGNISERLGDRVLIKPSGLDYSELTPQSMVLLDLDGEVVEGDLAPSSDAATHVHVYREMPDVGGVAHTHSPYATAFAARREPIPCVLTGIADEFGGDIPVGPFARIGGDEIGRGIAQTLRGHRSRAVLMAQHGVFTIGPDGRAAVKAAVLCEDSARAVLLARQLGPVQRLPQDDIDALHDRYRNVYGQRSS